MARFFGAALLASAASITATFGALADSRPFVITGYIEEFSLDAAPGMAGDDPTKVSATIRVNGVPVTLPKNMIIQMPGSYQTAYDLFCLNPNKAANPTGPLKGTACTGANIPTESGLALRDAHPPLAAFEATLIGNNVNGKHIAGLAYISKELGASGFGYVHEIRHTTGADGLPVSELIVGQEMQTAPGHDFTKDVRIRLNDPEGRFGNAATDPNIDVRFAVDDENPTIHAATGYPMCVPRSAADDPLCPAKNRPLNGDGTPVLKYVMGPSFIQPALAGAGAIFQCTLYGAACDQNQQAPFVVGDFINYAGTLVQDPNPPADTRADGSPASPYYISAHTIAAPALGIFTAPGVDPAYISIESTLWGTFGPTMPYPTEQKDRVKVVGQMTDPSRTVEIYAVDETGILRHLFDIGSRIARFGEFRSIIQKAAGGLVDPGNPAIVKGAPREVYVRYRKGLSLHNKPVPSATAPAGMKVAANGLVAGQYHAPMTEFVFQETSVIGDPLSPNNFECLNFLAKGSGPLTTNDRSGPVVGRLDPWPNLIPPTTDTYCGP